ncbi:MAG: hypothetical protein HY244_11260 [Rhizobiales bacterium]|nr:hypothetical protein [Hyphomicrobiales bacterium]
MSARQPHGDRDQGFLRLLTLLCSVYLALFIYFVIRVSINVPVYDLFDWLLFYGERARASDLLGYLWAPHNEHRLVLTRILVALDNKWLGATGPFFAVFASLLLAVMIFAIGREILDSDLSRRCKTILLSIAVFLAMPANLVVTVGMPAMGSVLHTAAFAMFSLFLLGRQDGRRRFGCRMAAVLTCACLAAFGSSSGMLVWPVLLWLGWQNGIGRIGLAVIVVSGAAFIAVYLWGLHSVSINIPLTFEHFVSMADYGLRFLGLPWAHMPQLVWPARLIGAGVAGAAVYLLARHHCRGAGTRIERLGLALILFGLLVAASAAVVRVDLAPERAMPIRYGIFVVLVHIGILLGLAADLDRLWQSTYQPHLQRLIVVVSVVLVIQQFVVGTFAAQEADRYNAAWSRFVAGEWTPDMLRYVYPERARAIEGLAQLRAMKLVP